MQGNEWDEQLVDKAWADMRRLLDQEMPVQEKPSNKGRFLWLFLLFGIFSLGSLLGYRYYNSPSVLAVPGAFPIPMEATQPIAIQEDNTSYTTMTPDTAPVINQARTNRPSDILNIRQTKSNSTPTRSSAIEESATASVTPLLVDTAETPVVAELQIITNTENVIESISTDVEPTTIAAQLPTASPELLAYKGSADPFAGISQQVIKRKNRKRTGVEFGGIINHIRPIDGYALGLVREVAFKDSNLGLRFGLAYRQHSRQHTYYRDQGYSLDFTNLSGRDIGASPNAPIGLELDAYVAENSYVPQLPYAENIKMHYADLPIALSYKLHKHWKVESGITLSYLLNALRTNENGTQESISSPFNFNAGLGNEVEDLRAGGENTALEDYNNFDIAASAGIGFYPHHKFGLRLRYDYGFLSFDKASNFVDRNRNIHFSAVYFLK